MRIHRGLSFHIRDTSHRLMVLAGLSSLTVAGLVLVTLVFQHPQTTYAATPPDTCFAFDSIFGTITDYYSYENDNSANPACPRAVDIPSVIGGVTVTAIGSWAFSGNSLTSVTIPNSVGSIGDYAFYANQLTTLPAYFSRPSVTTIPTAIFNDNKFTSLVVPDNITSIGAYAFASNQLTSVAISNSVTIIRYNAFIYNQLATLTLGNSIVTIEDGAFMGNKLTSLTIPNSVTTIGNGVFSGNRLTSVTIPASVTNFGAEIFEEGNVLTSLTYGTTTYTPLTPIPEQCFKFSAGTITGYNYADMNFIKDSGVSCLSRAVDIPSTLGGVAVTAIGDQAFSNDQFTSVTIPNSVTYIGDYAFYMNQLGSVSIPNSVTSVGMLAFASNKITTLPTYFSQPSVTTIPNGVLDGNDLSSLAIPDNITSIGNWAFSGNQLTSVTIPNSVTSIGDEAFANNKLTSVTISSSLPGSGIGNNVFAYQSTMGSDVFGDLYWSGNPTSVQQAIDSLYLVRIYTSDGTNPHNLTDTFYTQTGMELDGDFDWNEVAPAGGYIVNPASATISYRSSSGTNLAPTTSLVGRTAGDGLPITDYSLSTTLDSTTDPNNPTIDFASYYHAGDTMTFDPVTIIGYVLPASQTITLTSNSPVAFVYSAAEGDVGSATTHDLSTLPTARNSATRDAVRNAVVGVTSSTCYTLNQPSIQTLSAVGISSPTEGISLLGGIGFSIDCVSSGGSAQATISLGATYADASQLRAYKQSGATLTDITSQVTFANQDVGGTTRTILRYHLIDGGAFDEDSTSNGTIVDPIYIGEVQGAYSVVPGAPNTGVMIPQTESKSTNTYTLTVTLLIVGVLLVIASGVLMLRSLRRHKGIVG